MRRVIPTQTDCNWVESYEMKSAQAEDEEAQFLIGWLNKKKPELGEVRLLSPAIRSYFLCLCQFRVIKGVLYNEWLDDLDIQSLRLFMPKSLRRKVIEGCHDPPFSAHQDERKTLQRVKRSSFGMA